MSRDLLQIALEHHHAGRLRQAEAGYRDLLEIDPGSPDANHWLGVLILQAGQPDQAIPLLAHAAMLRPTEAAFWHNLAQACLNAGQKDEAINAFQRAASLEPGRAETLLGLALALLARNCPADPQAAVDALRQAHAAGMDTAELHHHHAVALLGAHHPDQAIAACLLALEKRPDYASAYYHLAIAHQLQADTKETRKCLLKAVELEPTLARAWYALALLDAEEGKLDIAAGLFRRAIKVKPDYAAAYTGLGHLLQKMGQRRQAMQAFAQALRASRGDITPPPPARPLSTAVAELEERVTDPEAVIFHYTLAAKADQTDVFFPPTQVPAKMVASLFNQYADSFDDHLAQRLHYRAPQLIAEALALILPDKLLDVLDLGCGTGLCGPLLRPIAATLAGVDLSPAMVEKAKARGIYDTLEVGDLVQALQHGLNSYDLLVAADVLVYIGDISPTLEAAAQALRSGGLLAFTVEAALGDRYQFNNKTQRFSHCAEYLHHLAAIHGFHTERFDQITPRMEGGRPVQGYLMILRRP